MPLLPLLLLLQARYRWVAVLDYDEFLVPRMVPNMTYTAFFKQARGMKRGDGYA